MPTVRALIASPATNGYLLIDGYLVSIERQIEDELDYSHDPPRINRHATELVTLQFIRTREVAVTDEWVQEHMRPPGELPAARPALAAGGDRLELSRGGDTDGGHDHRRGG